MEVKVIGAGLAGSEAALQLADKGFKVNLFEMRPKNSTFAHKTDLPAELVCSNSLGSFDMFNASGLLKEELKILNSFLIKEAESSKVPAGNALAVDRIVFSQRINDLINKNPNINFIKEEITEINIDEPTIIASGPLTSEKLTSAIKKITNEEYLNFFDAIAPIVEKDSINFKKAFYASRYNKGEASYINCPMTKEEYAKFYNILINSPTIELQNFEKDAKFFESCLPIEILASRGIDTLRFGPMKPIGLVDDRTKQVNHAVVQLRQDDLKANLYNLVGFQTNLKWSAQKELLHSIPGLENVNILRYGVMHKNIFINSPKLLNSSLQMRKYPNIFFAGQITGTEGYTESIADGLLAALNMSNFLNNKSLIKLPSTTMIGALTNYISFKEHKKFQPINSNWGILDTMPMDRKTKKDKKLKNALLGKRALEDLKNTVNLFC